VQCVGEFELPQVAVGTTFITQMALRGGTVSVRPGSLLHFDRHKCVEAEEKVGGDGMIESTNNNSAYI